MSFLALLISINCKLISSQLITYINDDFSNGIDPTIWDISGADAVNNVNCPGDAPCVRLEVGDNYIQTANSYDFRFRHNIEFSLKAFCDSGFLGSGALAFFKSDNNNDNWEQIGGNFNSFAGFGVPTPAPTVSKTYFRVAWTAAAPEKCWIDDVLLNANVIPTKDPTPIPTKLPTLLPTKIPTVLPTVIPTVAPTLLPSETPTKKTMIPTEFTINPTLMPTLNPTSSPTNIPTISPSITPSKAPSHIPTENPTITPSLSPSETPSISPTVCLTNFGDNYVISNDESNLNYTGQTFNETVNITDINTINCLSSHGCSYPCINLLDCFDKNFECNSISYVNIYVVM